MYLFLIESHSIKFISLWIWWMNYKVGKWSNTRGELLSSNTARSSESENYISNWTNITNTAFPDGSIGVSKSCKKKNKDVICHTVDFILIASLSSRPHLPSTLTPKEFALQTHTTYPTPPSHSPCWAFQNLTSPSWPMMAMNQFAHWSIPLRVQGQVLGPWGVIGLGGGGVCVCTYTCDGCVCRKGHQWGC